MANEKGFDLRYLKICVVVMCLLLNVVFVAAQDELDDLIHQALTQFAALPNNPISYIELERVVDATSAIIFVQPVSNETDEPAIGVVDWIYALRQNGRWIISLPGDADYNTVFRQLSPEVRAQFDDTHLRAQADPDLVPAENLLDYLLPYEAGEWATITRSYDVHGTGKIDFDLTRREIAAAKDGVIVYASDQYELNTYYTGAWWYWNVVIIQHGEYEYSLYGHIAPNSIPIWITDQCGDDFSQSNCHVPIQAGDMIGLEGNTGYSTNPHLHIELGQGFGVVPYLDLLDADRDGLRDEIVYAGYVYAEHNVGMEGYSPEAVGAWTYGTLQRAGER